MKKSGKAVEEASDVNLGGESGRRKRGRVETGGR